MQRKASSFLQIRDCFFIISRVSVLRAKRMMMTRFFGEMMTTLIARKTRMIRTTCSLKVTSLKIAIASTLSARISKMQRTQNKRSHLLSISWRIIALRAAPKPQYPPPSPQTLTQWPPNSNGRCHKLTTAAAAPQTTNSTRCSSAPTATSQSSCASVTTKTCSKES